MAKDSKRNLSRQVYGSGTGQIALAAAGGPSTSIILVTGTRNYKQLLEGQTIDIVRAGVDIYTGLRILQRDTITGTIVVDSSVTTQANDVITIQQSFDAELTGLDAVYNDDALYGVTRTTHHWMVPIAKALGGAINDPAMQVIIDEIYEEKDEMVDFITTTTGVRTAYVQYLENTRRRNDTMTLEGGFKAVMYNDIPIITSRYMYEGEMYFIPKNTVEIYQMGDWEALEDDKGAVFRYVANTTLWEYAIVKYCELLFTQPGSLGQLTGITEAVANFSTPI